jgi:hypothetical protein
MNRYLLLIVLTASLILLCAFVLGYVYDFLII